MAPEHKHSFELAKLPALVAFNVAKLSVRHSPDKKNLDSNLQVLHILSVSSLDITSSIYLKVNQLMIVSGLLSTTNCQRGF